MDERQSKAARNAVAFVLVLLLIVFIAFVIPFPDDFSGTATTDGGVYALNITQGAPVTGTWSASSTQPVALAIVGPGGASVFGGDGASGSFSFTSNGGQYVFSAISLVPETVSVQGSFPATIVKWAGDQ